MKFPALLFVTLASAIPTLLKAADEVPKIYVLETDLAKLESDSVPGDMRLSPGGKRVLQLVDLPSGRMRMANPIQRRSLWDGNAGPKAPGTRGRLLVTGTGPISGKRFLRKIASLGLGI